MAEWAFYMMIATCVTVAITAVGVFYIKRTLDATRDAVEEAAIASKAAEAAVEVTRVSAEAQLRAYLHIASITPDWNQARAIRIDISMKNRGQTPGYGLRMEMSVFAGDKQIHEYNGVPLDLGPQETSITEQSINLTQELREEILNGRTVLRVKGTVTYRDAFKDIDRLTRFSAIYKSRGRVFLHAPEGNYTT